MQYTTQFIEKIQQIYNDEHKLAKIHAQINLGHKEEVISIAQLKQFYKHVLETPKLDVMIDALQLHQSIHFAKNLDLPNPMSICGEIIVFEDHLELIAMPNSKLANGAKVAKRQQHGEQKKMQYAYRLDDCFINDIYRVRLQIELEESLPGQNAVSLKAITHEALISQKLMSSKFVSPIFLSSPYYHIKQGKQTKAIYAFARQGICDLVNFTDALNEQELTEYMQPNSMPDFLRSLIKDLLQGLIDMQEANVLAPDIDFRNIVLFRDEGNKLYPQYIDLANAIDLNLGPSSCFGGSFMSMAPDLFDDQIQHASINLKVTLEKARTQATYVYNQRPGYGWSVYYAKTSQGFRYPQRQSVDFKDLCWSLGVVCFYLITARLPDGDEYTQNVLKDNPFFKGLLAPTREARFSPNEALACFNKTSQFIFARPENRQQYALPTVLAKEDEAAQKILADAKVQELAHQKRMQHMQQIFNSFNDLLADDFSFLPGFSQMANKSVNSSALSAPKSVASKQAGVSASADKSDDKDFAPKLKKGFLL